MSAAQLLDRLDGVRQTAQGRWIAKCPAHQDRSPSLSVRELDDGRVLVHDFGGCGALDVLSAVGLDWNALFSEKTPGPSQPSHSRVPARDLLMILAEEATLVGIVASDFLAERAISETDWGRLATAVGRINTVASHVR